MPNERLASLKRTRMFLEDILHDRISDGDIKLIAYKCIKHYPWDLHLDDLAETSPDILSKK